MEIKLAEALLRRKELQEKVRQLGEINTRELYEVKAKRTKVTDDVDDIVAQVPLLALPQVTHAFDWHSKRLRQIDAVIQQANWETTVEVADMDDYIEPAELRRRV